MKEGKRKAVNWEAAREFYCYSFAVTLEDVAEKFGITPGTVRKRSSLEFWAEEREKARIHNLDKVVNEALKRAFVNRTEAIQALLCIEYLEGLSHFRQLQEIRTEHGKGWSPQQHKVFAEAKGLVLGHARLSLGMPTEIGATPEEAEKSGLVLEDIDTKRLSTPELKELRRMAQKARLPDEEGLPKASR